MGRTPVSTSKKTRKRFQNDTNAELYVTLFPRKGGSVKSGNTNQPISFILEVGKGHSMEVSKLNAIRFSWDDSNARMVREQEVLEDGSWLDKILNGRDNVITWNSLDRANITTSSVKFKEALV